MHSSIPSIATAHYARLASGDAQRRADVYAATGELVDDGREVPIEIGEEFVEKLRLATYGMFLACFVQGFDVLAKAEEKYKVISLSSSVIPSPISLFNHAD